MGSAIAPILMVAGGGLSAGSSIMGGYSQNAYYQNLATENDKQALEVEKTSTEQVGYIKDTAARQVGEVRQAGKSIGATQKSNLAASNISLSSGTAEDIARASFNAANKDEAAIRYNADISAWQTMKNAKQTATNLRTQAKGYRQAGTNAQATGILGGIGSLLGNAPLFATAFKKAAEEE